MAGEEVRSHEQRAQTAKWGELLSTQLSLLAGVATLQHYRTGAQEAATERDTVWKLLENIRKEVPADHMGSDSGLGARRRAWANGIPTRYTGQNTVTGFIRRE